LASYLLVWLIQGGYAAWIAWQWVRTGKELQSGLSVSSEIDNDL